MIDGMHCITPMLKSDAQAKGGTSPEMYTLPGNFDFLKKTITLEKSKFLGKVCILEQASNFSSVLISGRNAMQSLKLAGRENHMSSSLEISGCCIIFSVV
eukprot:TRINITY_DN68089_c10_g1_i1.p2 TRINITY_DN68089_c10_g1~~TRINITY_DN68089_c10_g1_i1.p2  ORF type:complete len:100 (-),score=1.61 TRINITY_DN68089_c10_g1_i1:387-686(-)